MAHSVPVLRFRDFVRNKKNTVELHHDVIVTETSVWWGWWSKPKESIPHKFMEEIEKNRLKEPSKVVDLFLLDSGEHRVYQAKLAEIRISPLHRGIFGPEIEKTPSYYRTSRCPIWFKLSEINIVPSTQIPEDHICTGFPTSPDDRIENNGIFSISELVKHSVTMWRYEKRT